MTIRYAPFQASYIVLLNSQLLVQNHDTCFVTVSNWIYTPATRRGRGKNNLKDVELKEVGDMHFPNLLQCPQNNGFKSRLTMRP